MSNQVDADFSGKTFSAVYPNSLCNAEAKLIRLRRRVGENPPPEAATVPLDIKAIAPDADPAPAEAEANRALVRESVGLACSGGGIRSATFCLGVVQALAGEGLLGKFDLMSTVSGGGYLGGFLGALIQRRGGVNAAENVIKDNNHPSVRWLRENGYYLTPGGGADLWTIMGLLLRNWVAVHVVLASVGIMPFLLGAALRRSLWNLEWWNRCETLYFLPRNKVGVPLSPWVLLTIVSFAFLMFAPGAWYWTTQWIKKDVQARNRAQNTLTQFLGFGSLCTAAVTLVMIMGSLSMWVYDLIISGQVAREFLMLYTAAIGGFGVIYRYAGKLVKLAGPAGASSPSLRFIGGVAGFLWLFLFWLGLGVLGYWILWWDGGAVEDCSRTHWYDCLPGGRPWEYPSSGHDLKSLGENCIYYWVFFVVWFSGVFLLARKYMFVNLSTMGQYYGGRLRRAYLGASNDARISGTTSIVQADDGDEIPWMQYEPHKHGGPLHIIATTFNETVSGKSQVEQRDRKGMGLAVGPFGLSVGSTHHARWIAGNKIEAVEHDPGFAVFPSGRQFDVEELALSQWISISGAAFTTGSGVNTSLGMCLLLGLANIRLGYWWDSGIDPSSRETTLAAAAAAQKKLSGGAPASQSPPTKKRLRTRVAEAMSWVFPVPRSLLNELFARFHGPARQRWYLSDGGHFENSACYELIRRRVRFILCMDCGQDGNMDFEDIGNLTRKARIDFGAEIDFLTERDEIEAACQLQAIRDVFPKVEPKMIGSPDDFNAVASKTGEGMPKTGKFHSLLATVRYGEESVDGTYILFLKPSLTGDESIDIRHYHRANPEFPQQSTVDQFFDESQWESYRKLGHHIMTEVMG